MSGLRGNVIAAVFVAFLVSLTLIGAASGPESPRTSLVEKNVALKMLADGLNLEVTLERAGKFPVTGTFEATVSDLAGKKLVRFAREVHLIQNPSTINVFIPVKLEQAKPEQYVIDYAFVAKNAYFSKRSSLYTLIPMLETNIMAQSQYAAGSDGSFRVVVKDMNKKTPISGANVFISLAGKEVFKGKTDSAGTISPTFRIPDEEGALKLAVRVDAPQGTDAFEREINVKRLDRILLVTDKPLYQPGQQMHLRALALRRPDLKPIAKTEIVFEVEDSKGNKVFKRTVKTDDYGVASAIFTLASEVNMGEYKTRAILSETDRVEKTVTVSRYVLPKFKITFDPDRQFYMPGQTLKGKINAAYFFGKPVSNGEVKIVAFKYDVGRNSFATTNGKTDAEGRYSFELTLPDYFVGEPLEQGKARVELEITVADGSGHEELKQSSLTIAKDPIVLDAVSESGRVVAGVSNRIYLIASQPGGGPANAEIRDPFTGKWVHTDELGMVMVTTTPKTNSLAFKVEARDSTGATAKRDFTITGVSDEGAVLVRTDKGVYSAGDLMKVAVYSGLDGTAYIDAVLEGQTIHTTWTDIKNGMGDVALQIPMDARGSAMIHAYRLTPTGTWMRDTRRIFIEPATQLKIDVVPNKQSYLPAEDARIDFIVKDLKGSPVAAALGIQIVDESVFALQEMQPGLEKVYFLLEEELMKPRYEIHGFTIPSLIGDLPDPDESPVRINERRDRIGQALFAAAPAEFAHTMVVNTSESRLGNFNEAMQTYLTNKVEIVVKAGERYRIAHRRGDIDYSDKINVFVANRLLSRNDLLDPWGKELKVTGHHPYPTLQSDGPDGRPNTPDDIVHTTYVPTRNGGGWEEDDGGPWKARRAEMPMAAAAPDAFANGQGMMAGEAKKLDRPAGQNAPPKDGGGEEPRIRSYFPETLWVEPSLITDGSGRASMTVPMADSITTWRLTAMANSRNGGLGSATQGIRVFQEFFVDVNMPVAFTRNDRVTIPVAIFNYLPGQQTVRLEIVEEKWFDLNGDAVQTVKLEKNEVKGIGFDITVRDVGFHAITIKAYGTSRNDAVRREVEIIPDGQEFVSTYSGRLEGKTEHQIAFPADVVPGANKLFVKIYPGILSQVIEGLDNIFRMPGGCFEQTSSTTYPNILVLDYMQKSKKITPELKMKAEGFINNGYQRLLTFEVKGGGFEWFGQAPAHIVLTAYGLMEFYDMSKVYTVDPAVITRTQNWLVSMQKPNGTWEPTTHYLDQVAARFANDILRNTAYVAWSLGETGYKGAGLDRALGFIREHRGEAKDNYTKALIVMALAANDPKDPLARELAGKLIEGAKVKGKGIFLEAGADTAVHSGGASADVETTALLGYALIRMGLYREATEKIINFITENKDSYGTWHSTQATVFALKTLIASLGMASKGGDAEVTVMVDGKDRGKFSLKGDMAELLQQTELSELATTGNHVVSLKISGEGNAFYSVVARHYVPWNKLPPTAKAPFSITVDYDRKELETNDTVTVTATAKNLVNATAHMIILDLGIPPGFEVMTDDLDRYVENKTIQKYSTTGRQIIVYLEKIDPNGKIELKYKMKATMPMRGQTFSSRVYEYYNPSRESFANPTNIEVK